MIAEILKQTDIPVDTNDSESCLLAESALDWILNNSTLVFDKTDPEALCALPAGAKVFVKRFITIMTVDNTIASESLGGMSQSFNTSSSKYDLLMDAARELLSGYLKSDFEFISAKSRWK